MPEEKKNTITIDAQEYANLCCIHDRYQMLISAILLKAEISFDGDSLRFEYDSINTLLWSLERSAYETRFNELYQKKYGVIPVTEDQE